MSRKSTAFVICVMGVSIAPGMDKPAIEEITAACAKNYDRLQSWIVKSTQSIESRSVRGEIRYVHAYDIRSDGNKVSVRWQEWGERNKGAKPVAQEKATYRSLSWYGDRYVNYGRRSDPNDAGSAIIDATPPDSDIKFLQYKNPCSYLAGFCCLGAYERIDALFRQARTISVRNGSELINGVGCYVVDANTPNGNITAWIDPQHGYNIARIDQRRSRAEGHLDYGEPMQKREVTFTLQSTRFQTVDGVWLPMEFEWTAHTVHANGESATDKRHVRIDEALLNPDHDALGTLVLNDIRNGADVWVPPVLQIRYTWNDGKLVTRIDEGVVAAINKTLGKMLAPEGSASDANRPESNAEAQSARAYGERPRRPHCGLYCLYSVLRLGGQKLDYRDLVKTEYFGSQGGSTLAELRRGAVDYGLYAEVMSRLSTGALRGCPYTAVLHVKPHAEAREYNHYELFMGIEDGKAKMFNPPEPPSLVSFQELAGRWDGAALLLSAQALNVDKVLTADRQRLLLCGIIGVLALLGLHVGRLIWTNIVGTMPRRRMMRLTLGQCALIAVVAIILAVVHHSWSSEGLLANTTARASVQKAYAGTFIPRISASQTRKLLGTDTAFIDARFPSDYEAGHFKGAISLPIDANDTLWKDRVASIPRGRRIVVYCQSEVCKFAETVSLRLMKDGFSGISIYRGGWNDWVARNGDAGKEKKTPVGPGGATKPVLSPRREERQE